MALIRVVGVSTEVLNGLESSLVCMVSILTMLSKPPKTPMLKLIAVGNLNYTVLNYTVLNLCVTFEGRHVYN